MVAPTAKVRVAPLPQGQDQSRGGALSMVRRMAVPAPLVDGDRSFRS